MADAIESRDFEHLPGELGDLLFQVVYYSQLAGRRALRLRHGGRCHYPQAGAPTPACLSDGDLYGSPELPRLDEAAIKRRWEEIKAEERAEKAAAPEQLSLLDDVPSALPALSRAAKLQKRAAQVGFDWPEALPVVDKVREELDEVLEAMSETIRRPSPKSWATCCSWWSTWRAISRSIRKTPCVRPTASSSGASASSNRPCGTRDDPSRIATSKSWTPSGAKPRRPSGRRPAAEDGAQRWMSSCASTTMPLGAARIRSHRAHLNSPKRRAET